MFSPGDAVAVDAARDGAAGDGDGDGDVSIASASAAAAGAGDRVAPPPPPVPVFTDSPYLALSELVAVVVVEDIDKVDPVCLYCIVIKIVESRRRALDACQKK